MQGDRIRLRVDGFRDRLPSMMLLMVVTYRMPLVARNVWYLDEEPLASDVLEARLYNAELHRTLKINVMHEQMRAQLRRGAYRSGEQELSKDGSPSSP